MFLLDKTPHTVAKIEEWAGRTEEFQKRAAFTLLACVALHDKRIEEEALRRGLALIEAAAGDDRNYVKKSVSWALRALTKTAAKTKTIGEPRSRLDR